MKEGTFFEHLLGAGLAIGLGICSEAVSRKQELSLAELADKETVFSGKVEPHLGVTLVEAG